MKRWLFLVFALVGATPLSAQAPPEAVLPARVPVQSPRPPQPALPAHFLATFRYSILAPRDQHVALYDRMVDDLKELGFEFDPPLEQRPNTDREDPFKNMMQGRVPGANVMHLLENPSIETVLVRPPGVALPDDPNLPVHVRLELAGGMPVERQRALREQVRALVFELGFREAVAYDTRGYTGQRLTRLVGTIPRRNLETLLKDLRTQPGGWFAPQLRTGALPLPVASLVPIHVIEVLDDAEPFADVPLPEPRPSPAAEKISGDLWSLVKADEAGNEPVQVEIVFAAVGPDDKVNLKDLLRTVAPAFVFEGQIGQYVLGTTTLGQVTAIAGMSEVSLVRLPRFATRDLPAVAAQPGDTARILASTGLASWHREGVQGERKSGRPVRVAVVDTDFRGWHALVEQGLLPVATAFVDLTAERSPMLEPRPYAGPAAPRSAGVQTALAVLAAAPKAQLTLIRIDGASPYQLQEIARYARGETISSLLLQRRDDLAVDHASLAQRRAVLLREREQILQSFTDETDLEGDLGFLGSIFGWVYSDRAWMRDRRRHQDQLESELRERDRRFTDLVARVRQLEGIEIVVTSLRWPAGYPLGGMSPLSRWFDAEALKTPLWFQAIGGERGQSWAGSFASRPGSTALRFAAENAELPKGSWTHELNFLRWLPHAGGESVELPAGLKLRFSLQWREPHDPNFFARSADEDLYLRPLAVLRFVLLRQRDPAGAKVPADHFDVVARSFGLPQRLEHLPGGSTYEIVLDAELKAGGRYALQIEGMPEAVWVVEPDPVTKLPELKQVRLPLATGTRPASVATLPALEPTWELRPRLFVETLDPAHRQQGRVVLGDFNTDPGSIAVPADARAVLSVGAMDFERRPRPEVPRGSPAFVDLMRRPALWTYDGFELAGASAQGSSLSAGFAAGATAAMLGSGMTREQVRDWLASMEGRSFRVPERK